MLDKMDLIQRTNTMLMRDEIDMLKLQLKKLTYIVFYNDITPSQMERYVDLSMQLTSQIKYLYTDNECCAEEDLDYSLEEILSRINKEEE